MINEQLQQRQSYIIRLSSAERSWRPNSGSKVTSMDCNDNSKSQLSQLQQATSSWPVVSLSSFPLPWACAAHPQLQATTAAEAMTATTAITATAVPMHSKLSDQMFNNHPLEKSQDTKIHHKNLFTFENFLYPYIRLPDSVYYNGHLDFQEKKNFLYFQAQV